MPVLSSNRQFPRSWIGVGVGIMFLVLSLIFAIPGYRQWNECRALSRYAQATAEILTHDMEFRSSRPPEFMPTIHYRYSVGGQNFEGFRFEVTPVSFRAKGEADTYVQNVRLATPLLVWYDPLHPERSVLFRTFDRTNFATAAIMAAFFAGAGALLFALGVKMRPKAHR